MIEILDERWTTLLWESFSMETQIEIPRRTGSISRLIGAGLRCSGKEMEEGVAELLGAQHGILFAFSFHFPFGTCRLGSAAAHGASCGGVVLGFVQ